MFIFFFFCEGKDQFLFEKFEFDNKERVSVFVLKSINGVNVNTLTP